MLIPKEVLIFGQKIVGDTNAGGRYKLDSIFIEKTGDKKYRAVAINTTLLSIIKWEQDDLEDIKNYPKIEGIKDNDKELEDSIVLEQNDLTEVSKSIPKNKNDRQVVKNFVVMNPVSDNEIQFGINNEKDSKILNLKQPDHPFFPVIDDYIEKSEADASVKVKIKLLENLLHSAKKAGCNTVTLEVRKKENSPLTVQGGTFQYDSPVKFYGLIMPIGN